MHNVVQIMRMDCGCVFINGGAITLCPEALIKDGILSHIPKPKEFFSFDDEEFLRKMKIGVRVA